MTTRKIVRMVIRKAVGKVIRRTTMKATRKITRKVIKFRRKTRILSSKMLMARQTLPRRPI